MSLPTLSTITYPIEQIAPEPCYVVRSVRCYPYWVRATMRIVRRKRDGKLIWRTDASKTPAGGQALLHAGYRAGTIKALERFDGIPYSKHNQEVAP